MGTNSDYDPIAGKVHNGGNLGTQPAFDGNDEWPYFGETAFANGYVSNNTWVSAPAGTINLRMDFSSEHLPVPISNAVVTMELAGDRKSATNGVIAGIVAVDDYIKILRKVVGLFDPGLCSGTTFDSLADQIRQAADILIDGSQDPAKTCDGISIGVGFEAKVVQLGSSVAPPTQEDPCAGGNGN